MGKMNSTIFNDKEKDALNRFIESISIFCKDSDPMPPNLEDVIAPYRRDGCKMTEIDNDPDSGYVAFGIDSKKYRE